MIVIYKCVEIEMLNNSDVPSENKTSRKIKEKESQRSSFLIHYLYII